MKKHWVALDGWRGYYQPIPPRGYELFLTLAVVNHAGKQLQTILTTWLRKKHIRYKISYLQTSNVFATQFSLLVETNRIPEDLRQAIADWFIDENNSTFSLFSGESGDLAVAKAKARLDDILRSGRYKLL